MRAFCNKISCIVFFLLSISVFGFDWPWSKTQPSGPPETKGGKPAAEVGKDCDEKIARLTSEFDEKKKKEIEEKNGEIRKMDKEIADKAGQIVARDKEIEELQDLIKKDAIKIRMIVYPLLIIVFLFLISHKEKLDLVIEWVHQKSWGPQVVNFIATRGFLVWLVWEVATSIPLIESGLRRIFPLFFR